MEYNQQKAEEKKLFKQVLNTEKGEKLLEILERFCHFNSAITGDTNDMCIKEGKRQVYLFIKQQLEKEKLNGK